MKSHFLLRIKNYLTKTFKEKKINTNRVNITLCTVAEETRREALCGIKAGRQSWWDCRRTSSLEGLTEIRSVHCGRCDSTTNPVDGWRAHYRRLAERRRCFYRDHGFQEVSEWHISCQIFWPLYKLDVTRKYKKKETGPSRTVPKKSSDGTQKKTCQTDLTITLHSNSECYF